MNPLDTVTIVSSKVATRVFGLDGKEVGSPVDAPLLNEGPAIRRLNVAEINEAIKHVDSNQISDGYHTFGELYAHRIELWITLCACLGKTTQILGVTSDVWRSEYHSDGEKAFGGGWFVLGVGQDKGQQITYHLPLSYWEQCSFAQTLNKAPEWDGHSASDVLERLKTL